MSDADKAYQAAKRLIAKAKKAGADRLSFDTDATRALEVLPPEIATLDKLRSLDFSNTQITDLTPLAGMVGMTALYLSDTKVTDLTPLAGMVGIATLLLSLSRITDLTPLAGMVGMTWLYLDSTGITDLAPLAGMVGMAALYLNDTGVTDLTPLTGLAGIATLWLSNTGVTDLTPLAEMAGLTHLWLNNTRITDLSPIAGMVEMATLSISLTGITDLSPIARMVGMTLLALDGIKATDLSPIAGLRGIASLDLNGCAVSDLRPILAMERLVSEPLQGGLTFSGCAAAALDGRIAKIADMKDDSERAKALFAYLQDWVPPVPPDVPAQGDKGLKYRVGPRGVVEYDPASSLFDPTLQQTELHAILLEDAGELILQCSAGHNQPFAPIGRRLERYHLGLGQSVLTINPVLVWKAGNDLRNHLRADSTRLPGDMDAMPKLGADLRAALNGFVSTHNAFASLHPDLSALDLAQIDPAERHRAIRDQGLLEAAIAAFAQQTRLILAEIVIDLRDLQQEALGSTDAALRAVRITEESFENLIKAVVTQAIIEARSDTFGAKIVGDVRSAVVGAIVVAGGPTIAATYPQLVTALQPHIAALLGAWHGKDYPVSQAVEWVMAKVKRRAPE